MAVTSYIVDEHQGKGKGHTQHGNGKGLGHLKHADECDGGRDLHDPGRRHRA